MFDKRGDAITCSPGRSSENALLDTIAELCDYVNILLFVDFHSFIREKEVARIDELHSVLV